MDFEELRAWVSERMTPERLAHAERVSTVAGQLALDHGLDAEKARYAGLAHDVARDIQPSRLLQLAGSFGIVIEEVGSLAPVLLHGPVAAEMLARECAVTDEEILEAVRVHSTGFPDMCRLTQAVFIADRVEPGREYPEREAILATARDDLRKGVRDAAANTLRWLLGAEIPIDTGTVATYNAFLRGRASG